MSASATPGTRGPAGVATTTQSNCVTKHVVVTQLFVKFGFQESGSIYLSPKHNRSDDTKSKLTSRVNSIKTKLE